MHGLGFEVNGAKSVPVVKETRAGKWATDEAQRAIGLRMQASRRNQNLGVDSAVGLQRRVKVMNGKGWPQQSEGQKGTCCVLVPTWGPGRQGRPRGDAAGHDLRRQRERAGRRAAQADPRHGRRRDVHRHRAAPPRPVLPPRGRAEGPSARDHPHAAAGVGRGRVGEADPARHDAGCDGPGQEETGQPSGAVGIGGRPSGHGIGHATQD